MKTLIIFLVLVSNFSFAQNTPESGSFERAYGKPFLYYEGQQIKRNLGKLAQMGIEVNARALQKTLPNRRNLNQLLAYLVTRFEVIYKKNYGLNFCVLNFRPSNGQDLSLDKSNPTCPGVNIYSGQNPNLLAEQIQKFLYENKLIGKQPAMKLFDSADVFKKSLRSLPWDLNKHSPNSF